MGEQVVVENVALAPRQDLSELPEGLVPVVRPRNDPEPLAEAVDVGVDGAEVRAAGFEERHGGGFYADALHRRQPLHGLAWFEAFDNVLQAVAAGFFLDAGEDPMNRGPFRPVKPGDADPLRDRGGTGAPHLLPVGRGERVGDLTHADLHLVDAARRVARDFPRVAASRFAGEVRKEVFVGPKRRRVGRVLRKDRKDEDL